MSSPYRQLALQGAAVILVLSVAWPYFGMSAAAMPWAETSFVIGFVAFTIASFTRQPVWWRFIHAAFMPVVWAVAQWNIDPGWFLLAFIVLLLIYRGALSGQVPLYFSNTETVQALETVLGDRRQGVFVDLGAGVASTILPLARRFPGWQFVGIENAPLTWLVGRWRTRHQPNIVWRWGDLWAADLGSADIVYAFLSPAPMPGLWQKVSQEAPAGSLFVSNSFAVPELAADRTIEVDCVPARPLHCYTVRR